MAALPSTVALAGCAYPATGCRASPRSTGRLTSAARPAARRQRRRAACAVLEKTDKTAEVVADENKYVLQTYGRPNDLVFTHGEGVKLFSADGREFLDFAAGIAVNSIGHGHPHWVKAVQEQAAKLVHTSNLFHTEPQATLAKRLVESSFADRVFYCNSGTEANEGAMKFARKWAKVNAGVDPYDAEASGPSEIVSFHNCFHGRTMGALSLTYKKQYKTPFLPLIGGAKLATYMDLESAAAVIKKGKTAAVFVEPVQGEGGINIATKEFLQGLRDLCDEAGALLVYDEVQCGLGRTGKLWAYEHFGVEPDMMSVAKPLAGGLPIGAVLLKQHVADAMAPGERFTSADFSLRDAACASPLAYTAHMLGSHQGWERSLTMCCPAAWAQVIMDPLSRAHPSPALPATPRSTSSWCGPCLLERGIIAVCARLCVPAWRAGGGPEGRAPCHRDPWQRLDLRRGAQLPRWPGDQGVYGRWPDRHHRRRRQRGPPGAPACHYGGGH